MFRNKTYFYEQAPFRYFHAFGPAGEHDWLAVSGILGSVLLRRETWELEGLEWNQTQMTSTTNAYSLKTSLIVSKNSIKGFYYYYVLQIYLITVLLSAGQRPICCIAAILPVLLLLSRESQRIIKTSLLLNSSSKSVLCQQWAETPTAKPE